MTYLGVASVMEPLAKNLKAQTLCLQFDYENSYDTIGDMADNLIPVSTPLFICSSTTEMFPTTLYVYGHLEDRYIYYTIHT